MQLKNFFRAQQQWQEFLLSFCGEDKWLAFYQDIKQNCQFHFHVCNLFKEGMAQEPWITYQGDPNGDRLFWMSNIFHYRYSSGFRSLQERFAAQKI